MRLGGSELQLRVFFVFVCVKIKAPAAVVYYDTACSLSVSYGVPLPFRFGARAAYTEVAASRVPVCACHASGEGH